MQRVDTVQTKTCNPPLNACNARQGNARKVTVAAGNASCVYKREQCPSVGVYLLSTADGVTRIEASLQLAPIAFVREYWRL